jgi:hypothetical protein
MPVVPSSAVSEATVHVPFINTKRHNHKHEDDADGENLRAHRERS